MSRKTLMIGVLVVFALSFATAADRTTPAANLTAAEIVNKNISATGGLEAWRSVKSMMMKGKMQAGGNARPTLPVPGPKTGKQMPRPRPAQQAELPFTLELKRPRKMRVELQFNGQTAIQVYDGVNGWKLRPFLNRHEVEPYTPEEMKSASLQAELDGPLVDYAAKGTKVELEGLEKVENKPAYKLKLTLKNGQAQHVWVDAQSFLQVKMEVAPRRMDGKYRPVFVYLRDYKTVSGVMVPHLLETVVDGANQDERIEIESVTVNAKLDDALFGKLK